MQSDAAMRRSDAARPKAANRRSRPPVVSRLAAGFGLVARIDDRDRTVPPAAQISHTTVSSRACVRPARNTLAPSRAKAVATPQPERRNSSSAQHQAQGGRPHRLSVPACAQGDGFSFDFYKILVCAVAKERKKKRKTNENLASR
jgi:hypothetical protein